MADSKTRKPRVVKAWAGFSDGKICEETERYSGAKTLAVFPNFHIARLLYEDVRCVEIREVPRAKAKR